ncbi:MAG: hypothetical protein F6K25_15790 [Okeania sp. SIO2G4]|uniref:hypothetical protein n=1 Tax=unclassified Okeania TaxID=2634635 RepID=UPI0013BE84A1|nr:MULTISPECIES: hypothetical protein [unclassified Okeania]NEP07016.1 hypothetical protein [Okeania sp. SIO4D6]NEP41546.1 hypothetical protein [Okeania sp. SIO2H7]NEP71554.1 hypothetical protein [Okeania sp. SIO2G5]NEP92526.1 hypothetical protein [Okeania sp. SIO2F5]NEQ92079.1 hypothetical protein [Okeania sp. SIO2G4]
MVKKISKEGVRRQETGVRREERRKKEEGRNKSKDNFSISKENSLWQFYLEFSLLFLLYFHRFSVLPI